MQTTNPCVWTIAGQDATGVVGIDADLATFEDFNISGYAIPTLHSVQDHKKIHQRKLCKADSIQTQLNNLQKNFAPQAIKLGALGNKSIIQKLQSFLIHYSGAIVYDPVLSSTSGYTLTSSTAHKAILKLLLPLVTVFTPNLIEASQLLDMPVNNYSQIKQSAEKFLALGCQAVLIKGGHLSSNYLYDYFTNGSDSFWLNAIPIKQTNGQRKQVRGTGCRLSAAITACLASGNNLYDSLLNARLYLQSKIRQAKPTNNHTCIMLNQPQTSLTEDLPWISAQPQAKTTIIFPPCNKATLRLYPIVDSSEWVAFLLQQNIKTLQLRIKNQPLSQIEKEIKNSISLAKQYHANLFINDYWQLAIQYQAYGVHLGQTDLATADVSAIADAGLRLGISTHCAYEIARAHAMRPSYIAYGPIYPTTSKVMPFSPRGLTQLRYWRQVLADYPLVAIGGINLHNYQEVLATGVDGIAMISAITQATHPANTIQQLMR
jgi:hydroxymethylpyrimidine kinase/phosphomethylpyrimidine kinase/thiamine-phosphate diphosphorylase